MKTVFSVLFPVLFLSAHLCYADGLGSLIEVSNSMDQAQKAYDAETAQFEGLKTALESGAIEKGMSRDDILKKYGKPQVSFREALSQRQKWVYKPGTSDYFTGMKIYMFFDDGGLLEEIQEIELIGK